MGDSIESNYFATRLCERRSDRVLHQIPGISNE